MCQMLLRPPEWLKATIQKEARRVGVTTNALVLQILCAWADANGISPATTGQVVDPSQIQIEMPGGSTPPPALPPAG